MKLKISIRKIIRIFDKKIKIAPLLLGYTLCIILNFHNISMFVIQSSYIIGRHLQPFEEFLEKHLTIPGMNIWQGIIFPYAIISSAYLLWPFLSNNIRAWRKKYQPKWLEEPLIKILTNLIAGFFFAFCIKTYLSYGNVSIVYDYPMAKFEKRSNPELSPRKIEYIEGVYYGNKTDHPFEIITSASPSFNGISKLENWKEEIVQMLDQANIQIKSDQSLTINKNDYIRNKLIINIQPAEVSKEEFLKEVSHLAESVTFIVTATVKYPIEYTTTQSVTMICPYRKTILDAYKNPSSYYP